MGLTEGGMEEGRNGVSPIQRNSGGSPIAGPISELLFVLRLLLH
jgi:hypothetical protein